jgi:hypothetical protein
MPYKPKSGGHASRTTTIRKAYKDADFEEKDMTERIEEQVPINSLVDEEGEEETASVTASVSTKVSDAVRYGDGTWDKVPYSVEVFSSVTLTCDQTEPAVRAGHSMAYDLAWAASRHHIGDALLGHVNDIQNRLFKGRFDD